MPGFFQKGGRRDVANRSATYDFAGNPLTEAVTLPGDTLAGTSTSTSDTLQDVALLA